MGQPPRLHLTELGSWRSTGSQVAPGRHSVTYLWKYPCPWSHLAKRVRLWDPRVGGGRGSRDLAPGSCELHSGSPARTTLAGGNSFYRVCLSPVVLEFSNAPCDWLPRPSHSAPGPDWPHGAPVILPTTPQRGGGVELGGLSLGHLWGADLKPPAQQHWGRARCRATARSPTAICAPSLEHPC